MSAIIVTGGKQYKVSEGDVVYIEKLDQEAGDTVKFDQVLAIIDGDKATFGTPTVAGASVEATVVKNGKGKKIRIFKYNPKKGYRKRQGHRQPYTKENSRRAQNTGGNGRPLRKNTHLQLSSKQGYRSQNRAYPI